MTWVRVAHSSELAPGNACVVLAHGRRIALCNTGEGFHAIDDLCTHDGGPLGQGKLDGFAIECPRHGARFDVRTGKVLALPAVRPIRSYPTRVHDGEVEVDV